MPAGEFMTTTQAPVVLTFSSLLGIILGIGVGVGPLIDPRIRKSPGARST